MNCIAWNQADHRALVRARRFSRIDLFYTGLFAFNILLGIAGAPLVLTGKLISAFKRDGR